MEKKSPSGFEAERSKPLDYQATYIRRLNWIN
jgi:hypothetical protein